MKQSRATKPKKPVRTRTRTAVQEGAGVEGQAVTEERKPKNRNYSGNILETASGRFRWRVKLGGTWYTGTVDTEMEANGQIGTRVAEYDRGTLLKPTSLTVRAWTEEWLRQKATRRSPATIDSYRRILNNHILPELGDLPLQKLRGQHLQTMYANLAEKPAQLPRAKRPEDRSPNSHPRQKKAMLEKAASQGQGKPQRRLSNATLTLVHTVLHGLLDTAVKGDLIALNVADKVRPEPSPQGRAKKKEYYRPAEVAKLLPVLRARPDGLIFEVCMTLGLRRSEACGLTWNGLDPEQGCLHLSQGVKVVNGRPLTGTLKTEQSRRTLAVPPKLLARLQEQRGRQAAWRRAAGDQWQESDLIFSTQTGGMLDPNRLRITLAAICHEAGVETLSIQALRRTFANLRRRKGTPLDIIAGDLGHSRLSTLLNDYRIVDAEERSLYARDLDDLL